MTRQRTTRRRWRLGDARGATIVEAAIATPLVVLLTFAIVDFASVFYVYLALESGVSQASRYGVTGQQGAGLTREDSIRAALQDATPTLSIDDDAITFSHLAPGAGAWAAGAGGPGDVTKVAVTYTWPILTPLIRPFFPNGEIEITTEAAMMNERVFQ